MTIHSWGAVAPNSTNVDTLISYIKKCKPALQRWKNTQVLVIDEGMYLPDYSFDFCIPIFNTMVGIKQSRWSMDTCLIQSLLSPIDCVLRVPNHLVAFRFESCTGSNRPVLMFHFPYPQLVVAGDFFQLPPVTKGTPFFAFESASWDKCIEYTINLKQVFRQKDDSASPVSLFELQRTSINYALHL